MGALRVAVDIGGTFTDVCVFNEENQEIRVAKVASTPNPVDAVLSGVRRAGVDLADVALFSHGTTVATNALITRAFPRAAMVTTRGFRDVIEIRRGTRDDLWDAYKDVAPPYIPRRHRLEVTERIDFQGRVVEPLDEAEARDVARILGRRDVKSVAVCFINAYASGEHESQMKRILEEELPGIPVCTSSEVLSEIFEHERFSTSVANAVVTPLVVRYIEELDEVLRDGGYGGDLLLLHSGGGVMTPTGVRDLPVRLALSGPAAGAIACRDLAALAGFNHAIGLDMGGTSTDITLVADGTLRVTNEWAVEYGYPICLPSIDIMTIGAGGGSIARVDDAGSLRNGPQSAGSVPGPACYAAGGKSATNTDANLTLGRLSGNLAGSMTLDAELGREAIRANIAEPLDMSIDEAALAVVAVANANMADAVRLISIQKGYDPRDFVLVTFGGAGPLHGAALATELDIPAVLVPPNPGISSALGCLLVDVQHDLSTMFIAVVSDVKQEVIEEKFAALEEETRRRLLAEGVASGNIALERRIDMRYRGQWRSLGVPVPRPLSGLDVVVADFHAAHRREFSFSSEGTPVEIYRLNVKGVGQTPKPSLPYTKPVRYMPEPTARRSVRFDAHQERIDAAVYDRDQLRPGAYIAGPAIVDQLDSTTVIPPDFTAEVDGHRNIVLRREGA
jgi:N-methylhydantoinase A